MFSPFEVDHIPPLRFLVTTPQAEAWYSPMRDYTRLEYEWVLRNVALDGERAIDGGAHHGHYALVLAHGGAHVTAIDPNGENLDALMENMKLNGLECTSLLAAVWNKHEEVWFSGESNGMVGGFTGERVQGLTLSDVSRADVVK